MGLDLRRKREERKWGYRIEGEGWDFLKEKCDFGSGFVTDLMKTELLGKRNAKLRHASLDPIIASIQSRIPLNAPVLHSGEGHRQRVANRKPATAIGHPIREVDVLQMALGHAPNVVELPVIVLG